MNGTKTSAQAWDDGMRAAARVHAREHRRQRAAAAHQRRRAGPAQEPRGRRLDTLVPAFVLSELKDAFIIGFIIFIPFLVIDLVVSGALMALGMMMMPPVMVSLPFKLLLFVLVDGWGLVIKSLVASYG